MKNKEKKKKDYNAIEKDEEAFEKFKKNFVKQTLRRATYRWPFKHIASKLSSVERGFKKCSICQGTFGVKEIELDHIEPVESVTTGFTDWNNYIDRLFVKSSGFQSLCLTCHSSKTSVENQMRIASGQKPLRKKNKKK